MSRLLCAVCALLLLSASAGATTVCVTDVAALKTALNNAGGQDTDILLAQGTYALDSSLYFSAGLNRSLRLLGGYSAPNCATRTLNPSNTVIDGSGQNATSPLVFSMKGGNLTIEGIRFTNFTGQDVAIALQQLDGYESGKLTFSHNIVDHSAAGESVLSLYALIEAEVTTNLLHDNTATQIAWLRGGGQLPRGARIVHNTITANTGIGLRTNSSWELRPVELYNNVLYGNSDAGLRVSSKSVYAQHNTINSVISDVAPTYMTGSAGNTSADPELSPATFVPVLGSSSINSGLPFADALPATDLVGVKHFYGSAPDRGAFEVVNSDLSTFTVANTHDSGTGSLRDAINQANTSLGPSRIQFAISGGCAPQVITLSSTLPNIKVPLIIDGYSQSGAHANTLDSGFDAQICVILSGGGSASVAMQVASGASAARLDVSGLLFSWFTNYAIVLADGAGHYVHGNSFGVDTAGTGSVFGNIGNLFLGGNAGAATIGGAAPAQRNLFGSARSGIGMGVTLASTNAHSVVRNNYIGTSASGTQARANASAGVYIDASQYNLIANNVIAGNDGAGAWLIGSATTDAAYNVLQNNRIGAGANGSALGNGAAGVWIAAHAQNNAIGGAVYSDLLGGNQIQSNAGPGVQIDGGGFYNGVFANSIQLNGGLPIDLDAAGPLVNDPLDADGGSNEGQNKPVITRAVLLDSYTMHIEGTLASKPTKPFYLNFYASSACDAAGFGPAVVPLGALLTGPSAADGSLSFSVDVGDSASSLWSNGVVTATATSAGTSIGSTSELSACQTYLPDRIFTDGFESPPPPSK